MYCIAPPSLNEWLVSVGPLKLLFLSHPVRSTCTFASFEGVPHLTHPCTCRQGNRMKLSRSSPVSRQYSWDWKGFTFKCGGWTHAWWKAWCITQPPAQGRWLSQSMFVFNTMFNTSRNNWFAKYSPFMKHMIWPWWANNIQIINMVGCIGIASSDQVQRQQQRDEPVRENTHLVLDTLASRLRSYYSIVGVESLVFRVIRTQLIYIQSIVCMSRWNYQ